MRSEIFTQSKLLIPLEGKSISFDQVVRGSTDRIGKERILHVACELARILIPFPFVVSVQGSTYYLFAIVSSTLKHIEITLISAKVKIDDHNVL